jgi:hypothetical protein
MRYALLAALLFLSCRAEREAQSGPEAGRKRAKASPATSADAHRISDAELVSFVRWQREFNETLSRQKRRSTPYSRTPRSPSTRP